ncbi:HEAT repeat domain-containing protein [Kitasatospora sp. NPDC094015]|uniref:HEAT repeat domain-containing protein n=1 Tax=Kitasatospora sp. NPDC094015 TaxID=3155205 RepID=UPI003334191A
MDGMTMPGMSLDALDAVVWDGLATSHPLVAVQEVEQALRRLALAGAGATEEDCDPLYALGTRDGGETPSAAAVVLPFLVALAADPAVGPLRTTLVEVLAGVQAPALAGEDWSGAWALLGDPDPAVRRTALPLARGVAHLVERWREEQDRSVRPAVLLALGDAAADPGTEPDAADLARAVLVQAQAGDDPVLYVAAVYAAAGPDPRQAVRQLDRLVEVFSDPAARPRFEDVWFAPGCDDACSREDLLWWIDRRLECDPQAQLSFATRLIEAASRTGDRLLGREAMDLAWRHLVERRSAAEVLLPLAGGLLADPDGAVRLRAVNVLAALGPASAPYADRLAGMLGDDGADEYLDGTVGELARWALARIGDPRALPGLVGRLRAQAGEGRGYCTADPRRPSLEDVLIPLRAHADVLVPEIREAIRQDGARGGAICGLLTVLAAWGEAAAPALPEVVPLLADTWSSIDALGVLRTMGPAAADAVPALRSCEVLDSPASHWFVAWTAALLRGDRAAALQLVGDAVLAAQEPDLGPFGALAELGRDAEPFAGRVRRIMDSGARWTRLTAASTLWSITGRAHPSVEVLAESVLPVAAGDHDGFRYFGDALRVLIRIGAISPAIRTALLTTREWDRRLSQSEGYERILQDEEIRRLIEQALSCPDLPDAGPVQG